MKIQTLLTSTLAVSTLLAQDPATDPFRKSGTAAAAEKTSEAQNVSICYEAFSLPLAMAAKLQRQQLPDSELYKQLVAAVDKETARQEALIVLRAKSGQKATAESICEEIYPTEYEPPRLPSHASKAEETAEKEHEPLQWPATPTAFDTRNLGTTLEIEPTLSEDCKDMDIRMVPETVTMVARETWGQGLATTQMPTFETQRVNTIFSTHPNEPFLIGTISRPPVS